MVLFFLCIPFLIPAFQISAADPQRAIEYVFGFGKNQGIKGFMEDRTIVETKNRYPVVGVLDGHGGSFTVDKVAEALLEYATQTPLIEPTENAITNLFHATNNMIKVLSENDILKQQSGSTASLVFMHDADLYCTQLGDSAIIDHTGNLVLPTHGLTNKGERQRAGEQNFFNSFDGERFGGMLLMTRAFGDFRETKYGLIATPEIKKIQLKKDEFLVFATDGISDEMPIDMIAQYTRERINAKIDLSRIAQELIILAASETLRPNRQTKVSVNRTIDLIKKLKASSDDTLKNNSEFAGIRTTAPDNQAVVIMHRKS